MSLLDLFTPTTQATELANSEDALRYAKNAFKAFWEVAHSEFPENMAMSFDEFWAYMNQRTRESLVDFGKAVYRTGQGWGQGGDAGLDAMREYARASQGRVAQYEDGFPKLSDFYDALLGKMNEWDVSRVGAAFGNVAKTTTQTVTNIASTAVTGYLGITAIVSLVGIAFVILSFRKK